MKIDFSRITPTTAVWCKTEDEARAFCEGAAEHGYKRWSDGLGTPTGTGYFYRIDMDGDTLCLHPSELTRHTIIPFSELASDKPLRDWTLWEVQAECLTRKCSENCRLWDTKKMECRLMYSANNWDLTRQPRFTEDEVACMRGLYAGGAKKIKRADAGLYWKGKDDEGGFLPDALFPSIRAGQSVVLAEIVEDSH